MRRQKANSWTRFFGWALSLALALSGSAAIQHTHLEMHGGSSSWESSDASTEAAWNEPGDCGFCQANRRLELRTPPQGLDDGLAHDQCAGRIASRPAFVPDGRTPGPCRERAPPSLA